MFVGNPVSSGVRIGSLDGVYPSLSFSVLFCWPLLLFEDDDDEEEDSPVRDEALGGIFKSENTLIILLYTSRKHITGYQNNFLEVKITEIMVLLLCVHFLTLTLLNFMLSVSVGTEIQLNVKPSANLTILTLPITRCKV